MCPECGSEDIRCEEYDHGVCRETGHHDAGEIFICRACGSKGDPDELLDEENNENGRHCLDANHRPDHQHGDQRWCERGGFAVGG
jgi:hypothetical protein